MIRTLTLLAAAVLLSSCGLAETATSGAADAASAAEQARQGRKMEEKVKADIEAAQQQAAASRKAAEAEATESATQ